MLPSSAGPMMTFWSSTLMPVSDWMMNANKSDSLGSCVSSGAWKTPGSLCAALAASCSRHFWMYGCPTSVELSQTRSLARAKTRLTFRPAWTCRSNSWARRTDQLMVPTGTTTSARAELCHLDVIGADQAECNALHDARSLDQVEDGFRRNARSVEFERSRNGRNILLENSLL